MRYQGRRRGRAFVDTLRIEVRDDEDGNGSDSGDSDGEDSPSPTSTTFSTSVLSSTKSSSSTFHSTTTLSTTTLVTTTMSASLPPKQTAAAPPPPPPPLATIASRTSTALSTTLATSTAPPATLAVSPSPLTTLSLGATEVPLAAVTTGQAAVASPSSSLEDATNDIGQPNNAANSERSSGGMSTGAQVGTVLGSIFGTAALCAIAFFVYRWRKRRFSTQYQVRYGSGFADGIGPGLPRQKGTPDKTESRIINEMLTAAYAAEDGQVNTGYLDEKNPRMQSYLDPPLNPPESVEFFMAPRRPSISARTETTSAPTADGELLSLYARSSRGLSWFHKPPAKPRHDLEGFGPGMNITGPVAGQMGSVPLPPEPAAARPSGRPPVMSMAATEKTSDTESTESTWRTWGVENRRTMKKQGLIEKWLNKAD